MRRSGVLCLLTGVALATACGQISLEGKQCDELGQCAQGFICGPDDRCVRIDAVQVLEDGALAPVDPSTAEGGTGPTIGEGGVLPGVDGGDPTVFTTTSWALEPSGTQSTLYGVTVLDDMSVVAVGQGGTILRREGSAWGPIVSGVTADLLAVVSEGMEVWTVGKDGALLRSANGGVSFTQAANPETNDLLCVDLEGTEVFVGGVNGYRRGSIADDPALTNGGVTQSHTITGIHAFASDNVFGVSNSGGRLIWAGPGSVNMNPMDPSYKFAFGMGAGASTFWAVAKKEIVQWNGTGSPTILMHSDVDLYGVWASSSARMIAVGPSGTIWFRLPSAQWAKESSTGTDLYAVAGQGTSDFYAVGGGGAILRRK